MFLLKTHIIFFNFPYDYCYMLQTSKVSSKKRKRSSNNARVCPICLDELGQNPLSSTKCGHVFCQLCLEQSLALEKKCPTCRQGLKGKTAYHPLYLPS